MTQGVTFAAKEPVTAVPQQGHMVVSEHGYGWCAKESRLTQ